MDYLRDIIRTLESLARQGLFPASPAAGWAPSTGDYYGATRLACSR